MRCQQRVKSTWGPQGRSTGASPGPSAVALGNLCKTDGQPAASTGRWELPPLVSMHERHASSSRKPPQLLNVSCPFQFPTLLNGHMPVPLPSLDRAPSPVLLSSSSQKSWWPQKSWPPPGRCHRCRHRRRQQLSTRNSWSQFVPMGWFTCVMRRTLWNPVNLACTFPNRDTLGVCQHFKNQFYIFSSTWKCFCIKWILMFLFFYPFRSEVLNTDGGEPFLMFSM